MRLQQIMEIRSWCVRTSLLRPSELATLSATQISCSSRPKMRSGSTHYRRPPGERPPVRAARCIDLDPPFKLTTQSHVLPDGHGVRRVTVKRQIEECVECAAFSGQRARDLLVRDSMERVSGSCRAI